MLLSEFMDLNKAKGQYWFSENTMAFFKSKVEIWDPITGIFVTSEKGPAGDKKVYSIREADFKEGTVKTISEPFRFNSVKEDEAFILQMERN